MSIPLSFLSAQPPASFGLGDHLAQLISQSTSISTLLDCLPLTPEPAIHSTDSSRPSLTHAELHSFISTFTLPSFGTDRLSLARGDRVAILLPNGPVNAVALLSITAYHTCAPINASCTATELKEDILRLGVKAVITTRDLGKRLDLWTLEEEVQCGVIYVDARSSGPVGLFDFDTMSDSTMNRPRISASPNQLDDRALVLCTSGTSGKKKVVPYSLRCLLVGSWAVVQSWGLTASDVNLNMMPLFHVGGIVRNLLAPVLSGGSTIVCPGFDAVAFWSIASEMRATWYYAAPTIHNAILASQPSHVVPSRDLRIRMICNAAGGLLPSLALDLQDRFDGAVVLPSYGMTECMPIASPPTTYELDRPGCSGIACGPHISIRDPLDPERVLQTGEHGSISVRGYVLLLAGRWFDTGDVGYLDGDGYLFITGRSKEIINKGGEVISPFEIEESVTTAARGLVKATLAFSVEHDVLQEGIGLVIVPTSDHPRVGLQQLHGILRDSLHPSKWPLVLVYMNDLPKNSAGKPQRINLAKRLGLPCFSDNVPLLRRHFEAHISRTQVNLSDPIHCTPVSVDFFTIHALLASMRGVKEASVRPRFDGTPEAFVTVKRPLEPSSITASLALSLPGYSIPEIHILQHDLPRTSEGSVDFRMLEKYDEDISTSNMSSTALLVRDVIAELLIIEPSRIAHDSDFFLLGGNSLLLGKLSYHLRKETGVDVGITSLFTNSTISGIAALIEAEKQSALLDTRSETINGSSNASSIFDSADKLHRKTPLDFSVSYHEVSPRMPQRHQNHPFVLLVQAIPFIFFYPLKSALTWTMFVFILSDFAAFIGGSFWERMGALLCSMLASRMITRIVSPFVAISLKWLIIGRYEPGLYPMWSNYHLRWWIVNQALMTAGRGVFNISQTTQVLYYRLLGAKIGRNVNIDTAAQLGEFDLLTLQDGCKIDNAVVRGFCVERDGFFRLGPINVGENAIINTMTQIAPGSTIPPSSVYGPQSSSHEGPSPPEFAAYNRKAVPSPHWALKYFIGWPIIVMIEYASLIPWFVMLWLMFDQTFQVHEVHGAFVSVIFWFANPARVGFHFAAKAIKAAIVPVLRLILGVVVKRIIGLNTEHRGNPPPIFLLRQFINSKLLSQKKLKDAFGILGSHYEVVSVVYRAMGAKIGRRVYWPGSGIKCQDPELLEIGDDVVFGSRSSLFTSDGLGLEKITIRSGAMIADRVVLLPGTHVGEGTVMGSGAMSVRNEHYPDGSMWIGNKNGRPVCLKPGTPSTATEKSPTDTITPFGRAFYQYEAPYFVYPYPLLVLINVVVVCSSAIYWSAAAIITAQVLRLIYISLPTHAIFGPHWYQFAAIYGIVASIYLPVILLQALLALSWVTLMKWVLIGRRKVGEYNWDKESYCQRWKLHLVLATCIVDGFGSAGLLRAISGTAYLVGYYRSHGAKIGKDCSIFASGDMGLITEPDLVELGDRVSLDNCSVVAHINSRGNFSLNHLKIGDGCALRNGSRLLSGASMEDQAVLGEHTLLTSGEIAAAGTFYVGWPGRPLQRTQ